MLQKPGFMDSLLFRKQVFTLSSLVVVALLSAISVHGEDSNPVFHVSENDEIGVEHASGWHGCSGGCGRSAYSRLVYDDDEANIRADLEKNKGCKIGWESDKGLAVKGHSERHSKNNVDGDEDDDEYQATHGDSGGNYAQYEERVKYKKPSGSHEFCHGKCRSGRITEFEQGSEKEQSHGKRSKYSMSGEPHIQGGEPHIQARFLATVVPVSISVEGLVLCQDCKYVGTDSLTGAKPLSGAKVKLVCQAHLQDKEYIVVTARTSEDGSFLISMPHYDFKKFTPVDDCKIFLVSSSYLNCSRATNINSGKVGAVLRPIPTFAPSENLMYSVAPFAFSSQYCTPKRSM